MPNVFASCDLVVDASWAGTESPARSASDGDGEAGHRDGRRRQSRAGHVGGRRLAHPMKTEPRSRSALRDDRRSARSASVGKAARAHIEKGYSKDLRITKLEHLYEEILRSKV
jgi:hypothetical protein